MVYWNEALQTVTGILGDSVIQLTVESAKAYVNGEATNLDVPAKIINDRTMVPVRFVAESLGIHVLWDEAANTVVITTE